jgi:uncharacterized phage protein gp47/JayE
MIRGSLPGADATIPNSVLRVMSDAQGGLCHLTLQYLDWLALQLIPDTAETEWLDRHGQIHLVNSDGTTGRKAATLAVGTVTFTGIPGAIVPVYSRIGTAAGGAVEYETLAEITLESGPTNAPVRALTPGLVGNREPGETLQFTGAIVPVNVDGEITVIEITGGVDQESDDDLRMRVLQRIRQPPMGGDANDYVTWTLSIPGVTRAWSYPLEMGIGTVTVRFMMDDLRADFGGFPQLDDVEVVERYLDTVRPVAIKDFFVVAPLPFPIDITITQLDSDDAATRANIQAELLAMLYLKSPGETVYRSQIDEAISSAVGEVYHELEFTTTPMPGNGYLPVLGTIGYS